MKNYKSLHLHLLYHYVFAIMIVITFIGAAFYWEVVNVIDLTANRHSLSHDKHFIVFILFLAAILSLIMGILATRRGLRSLHSLTDIVRNITTSSLGQRINPSTLPRELSGLGLAFNEMLDRIETSFARLKQMSADMSHELRTPIMNLTSQTELLLSYEYSLEDMRIAQASNLEELQRMSSIIENILFLARAENPKTELIKSDIHVRHEVDKVFEYYQAMADEKCIRITCSGQAIGKADPVMFRRLMSNIVSNALKYTDVDGHIKAEISESSCYVVISIEDTGIGILDEHLPKLFDRFYRVDPSRSTNARGFGLGLAIAKSIIDMHHGQIIITSKPNIGTKVSISLPKV